VRAAPSSPPDVYVLDGGARRGSLLTLAALGVLLLLLVVGASDGTYTPTLPVLVIVAALAVTAAGRLWAWRNLLLLFLLVLLFIPIRRYSLSSGAGFQLEPYRLILFAILPLWGVALLVDPRTRLKRTGLEGPIVAIVVVTLASIAVNASRINALGVQSIAFKKVLLFLSFLMVVYFVAGVVETRADIDLIIKVLVFCGAILSFFALIEFRTGFDLFDHMNRALPLLQIENTGFHSLEDRGGRLRVHGSGQHPIAYGAALVMLVPLAIYLARRTRTKGWWTAAILLFLGSLATVSRTSILMILVILVIYARLFPSSTKRLWPMLVPLILVIHIALPGSLGTVKDAFFPSGGLVKQQESGKGTGGSGRLADLGPSLTEAARTPLLGQGYGSRVVDDGPLQNAPILDDQWLETLMETGALGVLTWLWLFVIFVRRMLRRAREDLDSPDAWLYAGLASAIASFAFGMLFYDAFSFMQVTFFALILIALGSVLDRTRPGLTAT
jgi:polysaccharide biosynthesis protein PslJ